MKSGTMVTVEIVKAKDLKIGDKVLWANHEVEVMRIKNSTVWLKTWYITIGNELNLFIIIGWSLKR
jgi:hypothetical protein